MGAIKLDSIEEIAVSMAKVLGIGSNSTDDYKYKGKIIRICKNAGDKTMSLVDADTKDVIGLPVNISNLTGNSYYRYVEPIIGLIQSNYFELTNVSFTENEKKILDLLSGYRNYDNLETELDDNAVGVYMGEDIVKYTDLTANIARGVVSSLIQKDMLTTDRVNGKMFYRATDECIRYLYEQDQKY